MLGLDYSQGRPSGAQVVAARYGFVVRYLDNGLSGRTNLSATEVNDMHGNGVAVAMVWERKIIGQPDRATEGHAAGVADAQSAQAQAVNVGLPDNPIYFAVDFDIPDYAPGNNTARAKLGPVGDYFDGVLSVLPLTRVGIYGGFYAVSRALDAGLADWAWQTAAWSGGQEDARIHLFQRVGTVTVGGVGCDVNEARKDNFGQNSEGTMNWNDQLTIDDGSGRTATAAEWITYTNDKVDKLAAAVQALTAKVDAVAASLAALTPNISGPINVSLNGTGTLNVAAPHS
jgi:hypothetical protein